MNRHMRLVDKSEETSSDFGLGDRCYLCDPSVSSKCEFDAISLSGLYPKGAKLFVEGQDSKGVFILCSGRAKLLIESSNGRSLMRIAEQFEILGLSAILSGSPYEETAEMLEPGLVNFIRRDHFLTFLNDRSEASLRVAQHLSHVYRAVHEQMRALALSDSVSEKLARLLLSWLRKTGRQTEQGVHLKISLTHGEIAQIVGVSRETVTRLLGEFRSKGLIQIKGSNLFIQDKVALEELINP